MLALLRGTFSPFYFPAEQAAIERERERERGDAIFDVLKRLFSLDLISLIVA